MIPPPSQLHFTAHRKKRALEDAVHVIAESCKKPNNGDISSLVTLFTTVTQQQNQFNMQMLQMQREFFMQMINKIAPPSQPQPQPQPQT